MFILSNIIIEHILKKTISYNKYAIKKREINRAILINFQFVTNYTIYSISLQVLLEILRYKAMRYMIFGILSLNQIPQYKISTTFLKH